MKHNITYLLCPDKTCKLFNKNLNKCEFNCPLKEKLKKLFLCPICENIVELPGHYTPWHYPTHGRAGCDALIKRTSDEYELIYEMPEN